MATTVEFAVTTKAGETRKRLEIDRLVVAGWAGRHRQAMEAHIRELEALGVARPSKTPTFYRVSHNLVTTAPSIQVSGDQSSGEAEVVVLGTDDGILVSVGSDHTDRLVERDGVTLSKQLCAKPVSSHAWLYDELVDHWDKLLLKSYLHQGGRRILYQTGSVSANKDPAELIDGFNKDSQASGNRQFGPGDVMLCGTLPVHGDIRGGEAFEVVLHDPVLLRELTHVYHIEALPIED